MRSSPLLIFVFNSLSSIFGLFVYSFCCSVFRFVSFLFRPLTAPTACTFLFIWLSPYFLSFFICCLILCVSADVMLNPMMIVACHLDIPKFCKRVEHGGGLGNIISCLKKNYKVRDWKFWSPSHLFAVFCFEFNLVCSTTRQIKGAVSVTPLFLFTSGNDKLNCSK